MTKETLLCAAIHFDDGNQYEHQPINIKTGFVVTGRRHHNCYATFAAIRNRGKGTTQQDFKHFDFQKTDGFLTNLDRFVNRVDGAQIAYLSGQTIELKKVLFSEDLY